MIDVSCDAVVSYSADLLLVPPASRREVAAHIGECDDCRTYQSQIAVTQQTLRQRGSSATRTVLTPPFIDADVRSTLVADPASDYATVRAALLTHAQRLDPDNAEDLTQQAVEEGLIRQQSDNQHRNLQELTEILRSLSEEQDSLDRQTVPESELTAAAFTVNESLDGLDGLDGDADGPRLLYPDLYPADADSDGWVDSPQQWNTGPTPILDPAKIEETDEIYELVDTALDELPYPLGDLVTLVDLQGQSIEEAADALSLGPLSAASDLARARNHVRGRLDRYFSLST